MTEFRKLRNHYNFNTASKSDDLGDNLEKFFMDLCQSDSETLEHGEIFLEIISCVLYSEMNISNAITILTKCYDFDNREDISYVFVDCLSFWGHVVKNDDGNDSTDNNDGNHQWELLTAFVAEIYAREIINGEIMKVGLNLDL